jgi:hypothetical protein
MLLRYSGMALSLALLGLVGCGGGGGGGGVLKLAHDTVDITGGNGPQNRVMVTHSGGTHLRVDFAPGQDTTEGSCIGWAWQDLDSQGAWYVEPINQYLCSSSPVVLQVSLLDGSQRVLAQKDLAVITLH